MRRGAVISGIWLAAVLSAVVRAAPESPAASDAAVPPPSPVLVVYASANPGAEEARWLAALQPEGEGRRILDGHVKDVQIVTMPSRPALEDWGEEGRLFRASLHGVRALPTVIMLDSKGRVFDWMAGGADEASLPGKVALLKEKASRVRPLTVVNDIPKGGDPREEAAAICRAMEQVPAEAWYRDYPRTMKRLEKLDCTEPSFLAAREAADRLAKNRETASLLRESFLARDAFSIRDCLAAWRKKADDPALPVADRQLLLLAMVHPLWVRLEEVLYQGAHSAESEEAFNSAIAVLEEVRDMDRSSVCGRRAHQLREELRKARLAAARYD